AVGDYSVTVTNRDSHCDVTASFVVENKIEFDTLELVSSLEEYHCVNPIQGYLKVEVHGNSTMGYTYDWKDINDNPLSSAEDMTAPFLPVPAIATYYVTVTNGETHCRVQDFYKLRSFKNQILVEADATPLYSCVDDAEALAAVTFAGMDANNVPN